MLLKEEYVAVKEELVDLKAQMRGGLEEVRKMIFNLRPMALDDLGLVPTLRKFVQDFEEKAKIRTTFELKGRETRLPSGMEVAIFRLVQEAFSNVLKHSQATFVAVEASFLKDEVKLLIVDNGVGFNVEQMEAQLSPREAAISAGFTRFRPVLMTALAMIIGMMPMALGLGEGGEQNAPLGRAVIGGLLLATMSTLFFVPSVFAMVHTHLEKRRKKEDVSGVAAA